eukprot:CAMPEP_0183377658 /NCGR_PEP_ID=MMETSP0164_2-20130417/123608_1 /TAXON_ID=221442 /ORGANISM="Coccolithus pelagicus ssp braarudi, Strain PLY182g" /LENGTH=115 /DNA_ID=CAMNT_0025555143 /DNA_START=697 /DNA_END=1044 /DNA_ORIENTATION=+
MESKRAALPAPGSQGHRELRTLGLLLRLGLDVLGQKAHDVVVHLVLVPYRARRIRVLAKAAEVDGVDGGAEDGGEAAADEVGEQENDGLQRVHAQAKFRPCRGIHLVAARREVVD